MNIILGNSLEKLKELEDNSIDSIVTDPPYHLVSIVKRFGKEGSAPAQYGKDGSFGRLSKGFMGKEWDGVDENGIGIAYNVDLWAECLRVLKPGGHLLAFSGTRTYHRMAVAIEDAGFEVRDMIEWVYGSGFPKSLNISKAIEKMNGVEPLEKIPNEGQRFYGQEGSDYHLTPNRLVMPETQTEDGKKWEGWGTALKPSHEPICMARKPITEKNIAENVLKWGVGGINIDESRVGFDKENENFGKKVDDYGEKAGGQWQQGKQIRSVPPELGRFPANLIHDNSDEVRECFPETGISRGGNSTNKGGFVTAYADESKIGVPCGFNDSGNASRFFKSILYYPKASKKERNMGCEGLEDISVKSWHFKCKKCGKTYSEQSYKSGCHCENPDVEEWTGTSKNNHPTVKPTALMEYLIKMVTPKGGIVLDPFMGSGSTGVAAKKNGYDFIGIDMTPEYVKIAKARINATEIENKLI